MVKGNGEIYLISWNVNGIQSTVRKGFVQIMKKFDPDIICLQETKTPAKPVTIELNGYKQYWNNAEKKGYSGTAVFSKIEPKHVNYGMGIPKHDKEGRVITAEYDPFFLVNVYVPNSKRELERLPYRHQEWDPDFLQYLKNLEKKKPVVFCGDLNVAHQPIDLRNPKGNEKNHGFTPEEREGFDHIVKAGFVDTFRHFHQGPDHYTWWSPMGNCRARNIGWRIDYFCVSKPLTPKLKTAAILKDIMGSDHCPVGLTMKVN